VPEKLVELAAETMALHQQALTRYVTLDGCMARMRLTKEELIDRCSLAVDRVSGSGRRISERTFYNDIKSMRDGLILGREAPIENRDGRYYYSDPEFKLFPAGQSDLVSGLKLLEEAEKKIFKVLEKLKRIGIEWPIYHEIKDDLVTSLGLFTEFGETLGRPNETSVSTQSRDDTIHARVSSMSSNIVEPFILPIDLDRKKNAIENILNEILSIGYSESSATYRSALKEDFIGLGRALLDDENVIIKKKSEKAMDESVAKAILTATTMIVGPE